MRVEILAAVVILLAGWGLPARALELDGPLIQGGVVVGHVQPGAEVRFDGRRVSVSDEGLFVIGFDRDAPGSMPLKVDPPDGAAYTRVLRIDARDYDIQRIDGLPPKTVSPSGEALERIRREAAMVRRARRRDDPRTDFVTDWVWPAVGPITGVYGSQRILNGKPRRPHYGWDIAVPKGRPVRAPAAGVVTLADGDMLLSGGTLILDHGHGLSSAFLHLSRILVKVGQRVQEGDIIAETGASGRASGAHLDWRMNWFDSRVDPRTLVGPMPEAAAAAGQ